MRVIVMLLIVGLAGCADGTGPANVETLPEEIQDVEVSETLGAIRGVVVDETITPLAGANITAIIQGTPVSKLTSETGAFVFKDLEPGTYFLKATAVGFEPAQTSVTVVAGEEPPVTRILLSSDPESLPVVSMETWDAFLQCGVGIPVVGGINPCLFTGSDNVRYQAMEGGVPTFIQAEAYWEGNQALGNELMFEFGGQRARGDSPLWHRAGTETLVDMQRGDGTIMLRVFPNSESPTVIIEQKYEIYIQFFQNFEPREGYLFVVDGPCDPNTACN